ncbi:probable thiol methyltransferase 2 [Triticum dicoccoides]|uniref:probable thiol methyltransferase 2 n=1 Tax=Triticum dicoccoides TaxID=85692 RepID=UPI0018912710|nr:probable thiol methyltransferase 2 [Triticum dicoccoides]
MASTAVADANGGGFGVGAAGVGQVLDGSNPAIVRLRQLVDGPQSSEGWRRCWEQGVTPWDLGQPTPAVVKLVQSGTLPAGGATVLVPGCGGGYDAVALSGGGRSVVGLDVCDAVIQRARQRSSDVAFVCADFFTWAPPEPFHLIFDYTFFCALDPSVRPAWAARMEELLRPDGELITLMYLPQDQDSGPPYNTTVLDYEEVLNPLGFVIESIEDNDVAVEPCKGLEKIARWKKMAAGAETSTTDKPSDNL